MFLVSSLLSYSEAGRREILCRRLTASCLSFRSERVRYWAHTPTSTDHLQLSFVKQLIKEPSQP